MQRVYRNMEEEKQSKGMSFIESPEPGQNYFTEDSYGKMLWDSLNFNPEKKLNPEETLDLRKRVKSILLDMPKALEEDRLRRLKPHLTEEQLREQAGWGHKYSEEEVNQAIESFYGDCYANLRNHVYTSKGIAIEPLEGIPLPPNKNTNEELEKKINTQDKWIKGIKWSSMGGLVVCGFVGGAILAGNLGDSVNASNAIKYPLCAVGGLAGTGVGLVGAYIVDTIFDEIVHKRNEKYSNIRRREFLEQIKQYAESL